MLDKRKGPGAGGAEDPSKDDSAEHRSNSEKGDGSKVPFDCHEATDFLERLRPGGPWVLTAIRPTQNSINTLTAHNASAGCAGDQIEAVFLDGSHPVSAHVLEQSKPSEYLARQIARAREMATDPHVAKLNENYALVIVGDKSAILKTTNDGIKFLALQAFAQWYANRYVCDSENKKVPLATHWMHHPQRRQYEGIVFAPGRDVPNPTTFGAALQSYPGQGIARGFSRT